MHFFTAATVLAAAVSAAPYSPFPLKNGFPNPSQKAITALGLHAGGTVPNGPLPKSLKPGGATSLQLIALNEIFEVAYFTELYHNITNKVPGYDVSGIPEMEAEHVIRTIRAQEEFHALGANTILKKIGKDPIQPCKYSFPVSNFKDAIALAATFTDVVLGTLPAAQEIFAEDGGDETGLIPLIGSVLAQEGEQVGLYRVLQHKVPSAAPFLTGGSPDFAFTAIQSFIIPGSCPNIKDIDLKTFKPLTVAGTPSAKSKSLSFSVEGTVSSSANSLVYMSGQNLPLTVPITNVAKKGSATTFNAEFPFVSEGFARGLTLSAIVKGSKKYANPNEVAADTIYGPGLIEV